MSASAFKQTWRILCIKIVLFPKTDVLRPEVLFFAAGMSIQ